MGSWIPFLFFQTSQTRNQIWFSYQFSWELLLKFVRIGKQQALLGTKQLDEDIHMLIARQKVETG